MLSNSVQLNNGTSSSVAVNDFQNNEREKKERIFKNKRKAHQNTKANERMTNDEFRKRIIIATKKKTEYERIMPADTVCPVALCAQYSGLHKGYPVNIKIAFLTPTDNNNQQQIYRRTKLYFAFKRNFNEKQKKKKKEQEQKRESERMK